MTASNNLTGLRRVLRHMNAVEFGKATIAKYPTVMVALREAEFSPNPEDHATMVDLGVEEDTDTRI